MCEKLSHIFVGAKTQRRKDTKFLYIKYNVVSLCLCVFVFTKNNKLFDYLIAEFLQRHTF